MSEKLFSKCTMALAFFTILFTLLQVAAQEKVRWWVMQNAWCDENFFYKFLAIAFCISPMQKKGREIPPIRVLSLFSIFSSCFLVLWLRYISLQYLDYKLRGECTFISGLYCENGLTRSLWCIYELLLFDFALLFPNLRQFQQAVQFDLEFTSKISFSFC